MTNTNTASGAADKALAYLDDLSDDAAAHIFPSDLAKCMTSECVVEVCSVRAGNPNEKTVPLFSREQVVAALASAAAPAQQPNTACAALPAECDSPELCAVSRSCAGQFGTKRICASRGQAPAQAAPAAVAGQSEMHEAMCPALTGGRCTCERNDPAVDKAWARFCGGIGDGPDAPYPGMISAFERYYSQSFTDKDWRNEASVWAAAWKQALLTAAAPTTQPAPQQEAPADELEEVLRERDDAEDFINELLDEVLGADRPEWSSAYNRYDAMNDVRERITALHKPAVDKAWGRFESAMAAPQPSPASQGDALDAARYRFLRDGEWRDTDLEPFIRLQLNTLWDETIDAARAAQEGKKP